MDYQAIIDYYYGVEDTALRRILMTHSRAVADKALHICERHPELELDREFVEAAAMLHDIGIIQCDAPGIQCHGARPYIQHGIAGEEMIFSLLRSQGVKESSSHDGSFLRSQGVKESSSHDDSFLRNQGVKESSSPRTIALTPRLLDSLEKLAHVCSHHTGAGITREEVVAQGLDLPVADYLPVTLEEKLICYADKFFSKTRLTEEKTFEQAERSLMKFGEAGVERFRQWGRLFEM